jgi:HK97 family phage major capsid protein
MSTLSERVQSRITELEAKQAEVGTELNVIATDPEARGLDDDAALARISELRATGEKLAADLAAATEQLAAAKDAESRQVAAAAVRPAAAANVGGAVVRSEERTYSQHNQHERSFLTDAWNGYQRRTDPDAQERIERHMREVRLEKRDIQSSTLNGLIPPIYVLDQAAELARTGRPFANIVPSYDLPPNGMSVIATRVTTGTGVNIQTELGAVTETDMVTTDITIPVVTITGQQDVSRQAVERGALTDQLVFNDLIAAYAERLDSQTLVGTGSAGQHRGLLNVAGIGLQTYSVTTITTFFSKLAGLMNDVATNRLRPASVVIMHPRRWHALVAASDSSNRPLVVPAALSPFNAGAVGTTGSQQFVGTIAGGLPVLVDANVPTNQGAATNEDRVFVARVEDFALWEEGGGVPRVFNFEQTAGPGVIRLAVYGVSAFTAGRYPSGISMMTGTGLVAPSF